MTESSSSSMEANDIIDIFHTYIFGESFHSFESRASSVSFDEYWYGVDKRAFWTREKNQTEQEEKGVYSNYSCSSEGKFINIITRGMLEECIQSALSAVSHRSYDFTSDSLIQFWASVVTSRGGRCVLTTRNLPFCLGRNDGRLSEYRKHCISRQINVNLNIDDDDDDDGGDDEEEFGGGGGGVIGRVFRHKQMESTPDVSYYSTKEYPQRDIALKFGIKSSLALHVFHPFDGSCFGVLELVSSYKHFNQVDLIHFFRDLRLDEEENKIKMRYLKAHLPLELQIEQGTNEEIQEINKALQLVCRAHQLPLAQIWIPGLPRLGRTCVDSSKKSCHLYCSKTFSSFFLDDDDNKHLYHKMFMLNRICNLTYLTEGQGIVGKALLYGKPYFCRDVSQLPITEYALSHYMRKYGLTGCFAICIHGSPTKDHDYVLEFFLPPCNTISEDPQTFLKPILATAKKHLQGFEIYSGEGPGEELHVEVSNISVNDEPDNVRICQGSGIQPIHGSSQNEREDTLEKEYRTTETSLSRETLVKHFGKKLDDAADILGISRSTMKRACRVHGIKKWPFPKRKKFKPPPSSLKHVNGFVQGGDERVPKFGNSEPSCSDPPLMHAMSVVAHTISNITPKQDAGSVTVKATYGVEMIRFRLSFSSRKADLVEKMTQRFPLNDGTFNIKYEDDDGDWILIVCDEDLEECIAISKSKSIIKMLVQPIGSQAP